MGMEHPEWQEEQKRVDEVIEKVKKKRDSFVKDNRVVQKEIVHIRKHFWEDVTVNLENAEEAIETAASMRQQAEVLSERERSLRHAQNQIKVLEKLQDTPYFGRIDFQEKGEQDVEKIYLGVGSFYDEEREEFLVYDWRAPISSLYYDYPPGPAEYKTPSGTIEGNLDRKRQFIIKNGKIKSMFDTGVTIGDELLQEILGKQADSQMKSIVATIQKEQNQIIRNEKNKLIIVQGVAGSGKTSAALQRVAYLLYRYRDFLRADQIVLFSPNHMFNSYISTVLPELGEENMQQTTFQEYLEKELGRQFQLENSFDQMEFVLGNPKQTGYQARREGIRFKSSQFFLEVLQKYVELLKSEGMVFRNIRFRGKTLISKEQISAHFYGLDSKMKIPNRLSLTQEWLYGKMKEWEKLERDEEWVEKEIQHLDDIVYQRVHRKLQKTKRFSENTFNDFDREQYMLKQIVIKKHFRTLYDQIKRLGFLDVAAIYRQLFSKSKWINSLMQLSQLPENWEEICKQTLQKLDQKELFYEDATPFLYLKESLEGFRTISTIRHLFIDEAQDYSPFQFAFLRRLFPNSKMTVLGDFKQSIFAHSSDVADPFQPLLSLFEENEIKRYDLKKSYRSTKEIMEFARQLIPTGKEIEPFERQGTIPTLTLRSSEDSILTEIKKTMESLLEKGHQSIAVICKTLTECQNIFQRLQHQFDGQIQMMNQESTSFEKGILVIPSYLSKGIEFDAVLIADASKYQEEWERKLFYTVCTRAMHELHLFSLPKENPFLLEVSESRLRRV